MATDRFATTPANARTAHAHTSAIAVAGTASPNAELRDRSKTTSTITLAPDVTLDRLTLSLDLAHTYRGDLRVTLTSPSGKSVVIHDRAGGSANDLRGTFDLSAFKGEAARGEWTLQVEDLAAGDVGRLASWSLSGSGSAAKPGPISNGFRTEISGRYPPVSAGGFLDQIRQGANSARLAADAFLSLSSGGRAPPDFAVSSKLRSLSPMPPTSDVGSQTRSDYFSVLPGVSPDRAYERVLESPAEFFGAAGLKIRPATQRLTDGARLMLEDAGPPAKMWFPIEVRLDPVAKQIRIVTLEGHPLRGTNNFRFSSDGEGGTRLAQLTTYQLSSRAIQLGMSEAALDRQHSVWESFHQALFDDLVGGA